MSKQLSEDEFFMALAFLASGRSKDVSTQVGACIALEEPMKKIPQTTHSEGTESQATPAEGTDPPATTAAAHQYLISVGYNGMPNGSGFKDAEMRWTKPGKNSFVCHAEMNAIFSAFNHKADLHPYNSTLYVTHSPCKDCCKLVIQHGIERVVHKNFYRGGKDMRECLLEKRVERYSRIGRRIVINLKKGLTEVQNSSNPPDSEKPQKENGMKEVDLTLDDFFMAVALLATRHLYSKEEDKQVAEVGACLVSADPKRIISIGHSHKIHDDEKYSNDQEPPKLDISAASDAIANAQKFNADLTNATLYVTKPLDSECAKKVVQAGIKCVKYPAQSNPVIEAQHRLEEEVRRMMDEEEEAKGKMEKAVKKKEEKCKEMNGAKKRKEEARENNKKDEEQKQENKASNDVKEAQKTKVEEQKKLEDLKKKWEKQQPDASKQTYKDVRSALAVEEMFYRAEIPYLKYRPHTKRKNIIIDMVPGKDASEVCKDALEPCKKALVDCEYALEVCKNACCKDALEACEKTLDTSKQAYDACKQASDTCSKQALPDKQKTQLTLMTHFHSAIEKCEKASDESDAAVKACSDIDASIPCKDACFKASMACFDALEICKKAFEDKSLCHLQLEEQENK